MSKSSSTSTLSLLALKASLPSNYFIKSKYFKNGSTLIDELSYCCYYHFSPISIFTHLFSFLCIVFIAYGYICKIHSITGPICAVIAALLYSGYHYYLDSFVGSISIIIFVSLSILSNLIVNYLPDIQYGLIIILLFASLQFISHYFTHFPAFRAFEALVTTPFWLLLYCLTSLGWNNNIKKYIYLICDKWKTEK